MKQQNSASAEAVEVISPNGEKVDYPDLTYHKMEAEISYINTAIGVAIEPLRVVQLLKKMGLFATLDESGKKALVQVPPTRSGFFSFLFFF